MHGVNLLGDACRIARTGMGMLAMSCAFCSSSLVGSSAVVRCEDDGGARVAGDRCGVSCVFCIGWLWRSFEKENGFVELGVRIVFGV